MDHIIEEIWKWKHKSTSTTTQENQLMEQYNSLFSSMSQHDLLKSEIILTVGLFDKLREQEEKDSCPLSQLG